MSTASAWCCAERRFVGLMIAATCASSGFNVFFSGGPILLIQVMGVPAELFGWLTLAWAGNFVIGSLVSNRLQGRLKSVLLIPVGQGILTVGAVAMMATALLGFITPLALIVPLILMGWGNGLNMPNAMANALTSVPANRVGAASALMGFVQMIAAALLTLLTGYLPHTTQWNIGVGVAATGIVGLASWWILVSAGRPRRRDTRASSSDTAPAISCAARLTPSRPRASTLPTTRE